MTIEKFNESKELLKKIDHVKSVIDLMMERKILVQLISEKGMISKPDDPACNDLAERYIKSVRNYYEKEWEKLEKEFEAL